jgi:hypothetical protein
MVAAEVLLELVRRKCRNSGGTHVRYGSCALPAWLTTGALLTSLASSRICSGVLPLLSLRDAGALLMRAFAANSLTPMFTRVLGGRDNRDSL